MISLLVASTLVSATQCMKALYHGGLRIDPDESCTICVKVARYNPQSKNNHQKLPENANDKAAFPLPAIQQTSNRSKNVRKVPRQFCLFCNFCNFMTNYFDNYSVKSLLVQPHKKI